MNTPLITTSDIVKRFGTVTALAGVSISIAASETVAIMGPSGSGKSTLLHCLSGVLVPDHGTVAFGGAEISRLTDAQRSHLRLRELGFVFQDSQLVPELPARENVALPLMLTGTSTRPALRAADEMLARLGLAELRGRLPAQMSGGQAQRVAIARALVGSPRAIFADEPSGALDQATGHEMMQLLTAAVSMAGATLVVVTHDLNVARWCSRLIEIRDGLVHSDRLLKVSSAPSSAQMAQSGVAR
ncbi:ABC transporter ATP-binding protein [Actinomyces viscosus]|uniref:Lipoprotein-releasing system ATP-binding protein LolD n=1 Tax=Actinomyces viscosus TaxID=1656 RepID=A0A3S4V9G7_ACTVI|nr:ABC transporter ATP-binding protein [Actinomyces viscosus]TFH53935.1 ABC transporter ATP-binding protein [Actinomyces viscosus]VEI14920.1 Lipoprotein-releasing system ATP-binding protein LolD [Actinomyces viscosus]